RRPSSRARSPRIKGRRDFLDDERTKPRRIAAPRFFSVYRAAKSRSGLVVPWYERNCSSSTPLPPPCNAQRAKPRRPFFPLFRQRTFDGITVLVRSSDSNLKPPRAAFTERDEQMKKTFSGAAIARALVALTFVVSAANCGGGSDGKPYSAGSGGHGG